MYPTAEHPAGGIFVHEQVKALRAKGLDVRVVCGRPRFLALRHPLTALRQTHRMVRAPWAGWETHDDVPVARFTYPAGGFARPWNYPWFYAASLQQWLPRLAEEFPYDIVHVHTAYLDGRAAVAAARHRDVPMVLTEHTGPLRIVTGDWRMRLHVQAGVSGADRIVAVSSSLRKDMLQQLQIPDPRRLVVLPNGVDAAFFDPDQARRPDPVAAPEPTSASDAERILLRVAHELEAAGAQPVTGAALAAIIRNALENPARSKVQDGTASIEGRGDPWADSDAIRALWVGHHVEVKRVDRLLDAFAIARRHEPRLLLTLLGSGHLEPALRAQARSLGVAHRVRFLPAADREGVRAEIRRADFLVLPSQSETFGVVIIEALAMGLPVLATDCGGPGDIVDDPALGMLARNTMEDIALGLQRMARALPGFDAAHIRRTAIARFDYGQLAASLLALYQELVAAKLASKPGSGTPAPAALAGSGIGER